MPQKTDSALLRIPAFSGDDRKAVHAVIETPRDQRHKYAFAIKTARKSFAKAR